MPELPFHTQQYTKPDGRQLTLYGLEPVEVTSEIPSPSREAVDARPVMRWHPWIKPVLSRWTQVGKN